MIQNNDSVKEGFAPPNSEWENIMTAGSSVSLVS